LSLDLRSLRMRWAVSLVSITLLACGGDDDAATGTCLASLPETCAASIPVNYTSIYDKVLRPNCGAIGSGSTLRLDL
jgi:hypothetical protein